MTATTDPSESSAMHADRKYEIQMMKEDPREKTKNIEVVENGML